MSLPQHPEKLIQPSQDFDRWYVEVVKRSGLADDAPVRGCKVIRPYGYALWENIQSALDQRFKATGVQNAYFPLLIPESLMTREAEHIEGFAPEVAWVTRGGRHALSEPLAVRPSSEAIVCHMFGRWIQSYRDLPMLINQWGSVVRWEDRPRAFLRTSEFVWQEGHTAHATAAEADERALQMLDVYRELLEAELAIPVVAGTKSDSEKFAGAERTYTVEAMMGGKNWALQAGTAHYLGQNFSRAFDVQFTDDHGDSQYVYGTSWGLSQRVIGALVMVHGDDHGLKLPPRVAPIQVVIVPIFRDEDERRDVDQVVSAVKDQLDAASVRVSIDRREDKAPGWKFNEWELRGVPLRIEIGPRDVANRQAVLVRRDTHEKQVISVEGLVVAVLKSLAEIQSNLFDQAQRRLTANTTTATSQEELRERATANAGFSVAGWCGDEACERQVKDETKATIRCLPLEQEEMPENCVVCRKSPVYRAIFARAY